MTLRLVWNYEGPEREELALSHGWLWHSSLWAEFARSCGSISRDLAIFDGEKLLALSPAEQVGITWAPVVRRDLSDRMRAKIWTTCLRERKTVVTLSPLVPNYSDVILDFLSTALRLGWSDQSLTSTVLDPWRPEEQLFSDMAGRHRTAISNASEVQMRIRPVKHRDFELFRKLYRDAAGDKGRTDEALNVIRDWPGSHAFVSAAEQDGEPLSAHLNLLFGRSAYYGFSANAPNAGTASHALMWETVRWLKSQGFYKYELGAQYRGVLPYDESTEKERAISLFKRGFGGKEVPLIVRSPTT